MALIRCKDCGHSISKQAKACPNCGAVPRRTSGCTWLVLILIICFFVLPVASRALFRSSGGGSESAPEASQPRPTPKSQPPATPSPSALRYVSQADFSVVPAAKRAVAAQLNDPESAQFKDVNFAYSEKTGNVAYGWVKSKNKLGGYTDFQRFVANEKTVFLEEREAERTMAAWREAMGGRMTDQSLANMPNDQTAKIPVIFDVKTVVGKTPAEVSKLLGKPPETEKTKYGTKYLYKSPEVEILFMSGKANVITVYGLGAIPFGPAAIQALGFPASKPSFANEQIMMRWEPASPTIKRVQISRGQNNCDFATVSVDGWPDEK